MYLNCSLQQDFVHVFKQLMFFLTFLSSQKEVQHWESFLDGNPQFIPYAYIHHTHTTFSPLIEQTWIYKIFIEYLHLKK